MITPVDLSDSPVYWTWRRMMEKTRQEWPDEEYLVVCPACGYEGMQERDNRVTCPVCGMTIYESEE